MAGFVDEAQLCAKAGDGGAGCVSFRREAHVSRGGPDGGDGGTGGDVWLVATRNVASLLAFRDHPHRRAENGVHGQGKKKHGATGRSLEVPVPEGTQVKDQDGTLLADLAHAGDRWRAVEGGQGGRGNASFLSNRRRAPAFAEQGEPGDEIWFDLELKLMADVALVGFPNVGKSTLIARVSAAKPKIADYPFTTLEPNLGVVRTADNEYVMADIPGLIEGASEGKGLGHQFLRHIERARVLIILCDLAPADGVGVEEQQRILLHELGQYQPDLLDRPRLVVGSRADMAPEATPLDGMDLLISSVTGQGIDELVGRAATLVVEARAAEPVDEEASRGPAFVLHRPGAEPFDIFRDDDGTFVVDGREARRAVALSDLTDVQALEVAHGRLKRLGVDRALARAGAAAGDTVRIGDLAFDYEPEELTVIVVVKIGTSSITDPRGVLDPAAIGGLCGQVADLHAAGHRVVVVTSGGIAAGLPALGLSAENRPRDAVTLQAASAVGQSRLMGHYDDALAQSGLTAGQVLLAPRDFMIRQQYLYARGTLERLLELGVVPVINENDAIADDEIRFGDNDRLSALVAHLLGADLLILLTDTPGLLTADPRLDQTASLIEEIVEVDQEIESLAGSSGSKRGSGGMASKVTAAKIAAWSGVRAVIADARRPGVMAGAVAGEAVGTVVQPREKRLASRKLWIAFAVGASGTVVVDAGARKALVENHKSLLPAGIVSVDGHFHADDAVEVAGPDGEVFAKGLVRVDAARLKAAAGKQTGDLDEGTPHEVIHRDDLVVLP